MQGEGCASLSVDRRAPVAQEAGPGWRVLSQASEQGSAAYNEDMAGVAGSCAWIVDGSAFFNGAARTAMAFHRTPVRSRTRFRRKVSKRSGRASSFPATNTAAMAARW